MLKKIAEKMGADSDAESYHKTVSNTGSSCNIDCNQKYNTVLTGSVATAVITNTSGGAIVAQLSRQKSEIFIMN